MAAVTIIRLGLSVALLYGIWTETGIWTSLAILLLMIRCEIEGLKKKGN